MVDGERKVHFLSVVSIFRCLCAAHIAHTRMCTHCTLAPIAVWRALRFPFDAYENKLDRISNSVGKLQFSPSTGTFGFSPGTLGLHTQ